MAAVFSHFVPSGSDAEPLASPGVKRAAFTCEVRSGAPRTVEIVRPPAASMRRSTHRVERAMRRAVEAAYLDLKLDSLPRACVRLRRRSRTRRRPRRAAAPRTSGRPASDDPASGGTTLHVCYAASPFGPLSIAGRPALADLGAGAPQHWAVGRDSRPRGAVGGRARRDRSTVTRRWRWG